MNQLETYLNLNFLCLTMPQVKNLFVGTGRDLSLRDKFFTADDDALKNAYGFNRELINKFNKIKKTNPAKREIERCEKLNIKITCPDDENYPGQLKEIFDPPLCVYYKGELPEKNEILLSVVGARRATSFGRVNAEALSAGLAACGIIIVSGMARGIDTAAHTGALNAGGKTMAVLGCGLNIVYPPENKRLMQKITEHGACITEFPLDTEPYPWNFPIRNRIISALSRAVIVIEAGERSGSLITANCALEQGKDVFAMPGNVLSSVAKGVNKLIKDGAKLVEDKQDILDELKITPVLKIKNKKETLNLTDTEQKIYDALKDEPVNIEIISAKTNLAINILASTLTLMRVKGLVKKMPNNFYFKNS